MNAKDMKMIAYLRQDARMPLTKMSKKTQIPVSTLFDRLKANEEGIIQKHTALLDFAKLGYFTRANIVLKVSKEHKDELKNYLQTSESVNSVLRINNGYDFMVEGVFRQVLDMENFIENIEEKFNIEDKKSFFIIEDVKREAFMSDPSLVFNN